MVQLLDVLLDPRNGPEVCGGTCGQREGPLQLIPMLKGFTDISPQAATAALLALGLLLSQGGEFGFVLFAQAQQALLIAPDAASLFGAVVTLSMATTPFLMMATSRFRELSREASARAVCDPDTLLTLQPF